MGSRETNIYTESPLPLAEETDDRIPSFTQLSFSVKTIQKINSSQIYWELTAKSFLVYDTKSSWSVLLRGLFPLSSSGVLAVVSALSLVYSCLWCPAVQVFMACWYCRRQWDASEHFPCWPCSWKG